MTTSWAASYARRNQRIKRSVIRELLKLTAQPDIISFAGGLPAPELFPLERCQEAACSLLETHGASALQYSTTEGYLPLRQFICDWMARSGAQVKPENVLITSGSQQALDMVGKLLIDSDDRVLIEEPTYLGALQAWNVYGAEYVSVPVDDDGICTALLESTLQTDPKFMYILPNFQNPSGTTLSVDRRHDLIRLSREYGTPIVEDDPYGTLRFEGDHLSSLIALDAQQSDAGLEDAPGNVIYLGTFSKTLAPGLRLGWMAAPSKVIDQLVKIKQGADLHSSTFDQMLAAEMFRDGFLDTHIQLIRATYQARRDVMLEALTQYFPEECSWTRPLGGMFLWVRTPEWIDTENLMKAAVQHKVAYVPGSAFYPDGQRGRNAMRLNYSNAQPEKIEAGIKRLGSLLKERIAEKRQYAEDMRM